MAEFGDKKSWEELVKLHTSKQDPEQVNTAQVILNKQPTFISLYQELQMNPPQETIPSDFSAFESINREKNKKVEVKSGEKNITVFERKIILFPEGGAGQLEIVIDTEPESEDIMPLFVACMKKYKSIFTNKGMIPSLRGANQVQWAKPREYKLILSFESIELN